MFTVVDLSAVSAAAGGRLNNSAALHRRAVRPRLQRPLTQYQPSTHNILDDFFPVIIVKLIVTELLVSVAPCNLDFRCRKSKISRELVRDICCTVHVCSNVLTEPQCVIGRQWYRLQTVFFSRR